MRTSILKTYAILRAKVLFRFFVKYALLITFLTQPIEACKLWAVCTSSGTTFSNLSEESSSMIQNELNSFYYQSAMMLDGWSILGYQDSAHQQTTSICRSPYTAPNDSSLYWETVENLLSNESGIIGMGHPELQHRDQAQFPTHIPGSFKTRIQFFHLCTMVL